MADQQSDQPAEVERPDLDDGSHDGERSKNLLRSASLRNTKFTSAYVMSEITEPDPPVTGTADFQISMVWFSVS